MKSADILDIEVKPWVYLRDLQTFDAGRLLDGRRARPEGLGAADEASEERGELHREAVEGRKKRSRTGSCGCGSVCDAAVRKGGRAGFI
jgi:hypothetical protein